MKMGFIQRALISGIALALISAVVGLFPVLRRYSLFGEDPTTLGVGNTGKTFAELDQDNQEVRLLIDGLAKKIMNLEKKHELIH